MREALEPSFVKIDGRTLEDLLRQSCEFSKLLNYYGGDNEVVATWQEFFKEIYDFEGDGLRFSSLSELEGLVADKPHLSLLLAFLRLFQIEQEGLNALAERHLDFYYREMLGFSPKKGSVGNVMVFPRLTKGARQAFLPQGTRFEAGKDEAGNPVYFVNGSDFVVNQGQVTSVMGYTNGCYTEDIFSEEGGDGARSLLHHTCSKTARFGFAISSPILNLKDGKRTISFVCTGKGSLIDGAYIAEVEYTTESGWERVGFKRNKITVTSQQPPFAAYEPKIHGEGYPIRHQPMLRFVAKKSLRSAVVERGVASVERIDASVVGSKDFRLENDFGTVENKPMMRPFGMQPEKGSKLCISSPMLRFSNGKLLVKPQWIDKKEVENMGDGVFRYTFGKDLGWGTFARDLYEASRDKENRGNTQRMPDYPEPSPVCEEAMTIDCELSSDSFDCFVFSPFGVVESSGEGWGEQLLSSELFESQSYLYIGVEGLSRGDSLSLYFRLDQTRRDFQGEFSDDEWGWDSLCGSGWVRLRRADVTSDTTDNMRRSGTVRLKLPDAAFLPHGWMPADKVWLRRTLPNSTNAYPALQAVRSNAVELFFDETSPGVPIKGKGLPVSVITKTEVSVPGIKSILQPFEGEEGRAAEERSQFYARVSERLRHKDRAWTAWDYEHWVLSHFPMLAAVRTISCVSYESYNDAQGEGDYQFSPGEVLLQLLPKSQSLPQADPLRPKVGFDLMNEVEACVKARSSSFAKIRAVNPKYAALKVTCKLVLEGCDDENYYKNLINDQLVRFIAPWSDGTGELLLENRQDQSQILFFLEGLPYVRNIKELRLELCGEECEGVAIPHNEYIILTSASEHDIYIERP